MEALALVSGKVEQELFVRNEYFATENRILKSKLNKPVCFNDNERIQLAKIGKRVGLYALKEYLASSSRRRFSNGFPG